jgi:RNA polymerase sigma-70 factor, ECF subfamily
MNDAAKIAKFTDVYRANIGGVVAYARRMLGDEAAAEDAAQETFTQFYKHLGEMREEQNVAGWIFTVARNRVYSLLRERRRRRAAPLEEAPPSDDDPLERTAMKEVREIVAEILETLAPEMREPYVLKEYGGRSYKEIAELMGIDDNLVKSRIYKTRQKLVSRLSKRIT